MTSGDMFNTPMKGYNPVGTAGGVYKGRHYRHAYAGQKLVKEIHDKYGDKVVCLGVLGDTRHQQEHSDHNPNFKGPDGFWIVDAVDLASSDHTILDFIEARVNKLYNENDPRVHPYGYTHRDNRITVRDNNSATVTRYLSGDVGHLHVSLSANGSTPGTFQAHLDDHTTSWLTDTVVDWLSMASQAEVEASMRKVLREEVANYKTMLPLVTQIYERFMWVWTGSDKGRHAIETIVSKVVHNTKYPPGAAGTADRHPPKA